MRRFFLVVFALLGAGMLGAAWYVYNKGFTKKWRGFVAKEFAARGIDLTLRKLTLDPLHGLVAREVKVFDAKDRKRTLAVIDEMRLVINWANAIRGKTFLDALELRDANLSLPLDPAQPRGPKIDITRLSGRLLLPPEQIYLSQLEAELYGIRVTASGRVVNPQRAFTALKTPATSPPGTPEPIARILDELHNLRLEGGPPALDLRFSGDLARPETLFLEAKLWGEKVRRGAWRLETIYVDALYRDQRLALRQLAASDAKGALQVSGSYDPLARALELTAHSTLDPQPAVRAFGRVPQLEEFVFYEPPALDLTVRAAFGDSPELQLTGRIAARRIGHKSIILDHAEADLMLDGERWAARNIRLAHLTGELTGDIMQVPGDFRVRVRSSINPEVLRPLLPGKAAEWMRQFEFIDPPDIHAEARGPAPDADKLWANAALKLGRTAYRGVAAQGATATLRYADRKLTIDPLRVRRTEGTGEAGLTFDFARDEVAVRNARTTLHPQDLIVWIDRKLVPDIAPYRFGQKPPHIAIDGLVQTKGGDSTRLRIDIEAPGGMDYTFLNRELRSPALTARLEVRDRTLSIESLNAALLGGRLRGGAEISLRKDGPPHRVTLLLDRVNFPALTKLYFGYDTAKGQLDGRYDFTIRGDDARTMRGKGAITVTEGRVFAIPFLGPLSGILNTIVPGMGDDEARQGSASFTIDRGTIETRDFLVEGRGFSMIGSGQLHFLDDKMDCDVRINARAAFPGEQTL
jgi:hypothetical protein